MIKVRLASFTSIQGFLKFCLRTLSTENEQAVALDVRGIYIYIYSVQPTPHIWGLLAGLVRKKNKKS